MEQEIQAFIDAHHLMTKDNVVLVAVSGGIDSVVLAHALHQLGYKIALAHMNYKLRGKDSDADAALVEALGAELKVPVYVHVPWKKKPTTNLQNTARQARYGFFDQLCIKHGFDRVATAHHLDDRVESLFINLLRGTGIYGLKGIPERRGNIVRPLLWASRQDIETYAKRNGIAYRRDASNESDLYLRNRIRHHLVPLLSDLDPDAMVKLRTSMQLLSDDAEAIHQAAASAIQEEGRHFTIDLQTFPEKQRDVWLYHALREFGFNRSQCQDLLQAKQAGKRIHAPTYDAVLRKQHVDIIAHDAQKAPAIKIDGPGSYQTVSHSLEISFTGPDEHVFSAGNVIVSLDATQVKFPLTLRLAESEDRFQPLGLEYEVTLKRYLREKGYGPAQQANLWVITSANGRIAWIPSVQIAHWCRIKSNTTSILSLSFHRHGY
jgi:tRNA(Ile)-lysidine synthase